MLSLSLGLSLTSARMCDSDTLLEQVQALNPDGHFDLAETDTLFADRSATPSTPASVDGVLGTVLDLGSGAPLIAPSDAERAILRSSGGVNYIEYDLVNDYYNWTPSSTFTARMWIGTRHGFYKTSLITFQSGVTHRFRSADPTKIVIIDDSGLSGPQIAALESYMGTTEYAAIFRTNDTTILHRLDNDPDVNRTLSYIGANGATYSLASSQGEVTVDVGAQGLTAPVIIRYPLAVKNDTTLTQWRSQGNLHTGPLPDISGLTNLTTWRSDSNQHTGPLPDISGLTNLTIWWSYLNQHTGALPDISGLTNLTAWLSSSNRHTGALPDISELTNLTTWYVDSNQHTGGFPGAVPASLLDCRMQNNLLPQAAVDAMLAAFVAAGASNGTLNLGGTGNAAPSGTGATDAATLVSRGWTVTTN